MNVYLIYSPIDIKKYQKKYSAAISSIKKKHVLTRDNFANDVKMFSTKKYNPSKQYMYQDMLGAIDRADVCIFDITQKSMTMGQQMTYSLSHKKPTLFISDSTEATPVHDLVIAGAKSPYLTLVDYLSEKEMIAHIDKFLQRYDGPRTQRMTLLLDVWVCNEIERTAREDDCTRRDVVENKIRSYITKQKHRKPAED